VPFVGVGVVSAGQHCGWTINEKRKSMVVKRIAGVVYLVLAVVFAVSAISSLSHGDGPTLGDSSGLGVSRVVGAFLPSLGLLILGLWLVKTPIPRNSD
jgi:hypothetical protein